MVILVYVFEFVILGVFLTFSDDLGCDIIHGEVLASIMLKGV
jgi:hypothetical protein